MLGLPLDSFILLLGLPSVVVAVMFYYSWLVKRGRRE
jgi:hypothetical protein